MVVRGRAGKRWLMGAGAGTLLLAGGVLAGPIAGFAGQDPTATLSEDEAIAAAIAANPGTSATGVEFESEDGVATFEVTLSNGLEVEIDGNSGAVLATEPTDGDNEGDDDRNNNDSDDDDGDVEDNDDGNGEQEDAVPAGTLDDGADLLPQASITLESAIAAAQAAADGTVGEVDLEYVGDVLVFNVDIGENDVKVNATDGSVVSVDSDD